MLKVKEEFEIVKLKMYGNLSLGEVIQNLNPYKFRKDKINLYVEEYFICLNNFFINRKS